MNEPRRGPNLEAGEVRQLEVDEPYDRLDRYLATRLDLSRSKAAGLIEAGLVLVNGQPARKRHHGNPGDLLSVTIPPPPATDLEPEALPVTIVYDDEDLAVVDKPAGMVVHPAPGHPRGTLVNALLHHLGSLSSVGGATRPGIVHRLDRDTSGLLVVARTDEAHRALSAALARRRIRRGYLAAAWGQLSEEEMTISRPIGRDPKDRKRMAVVDDGRPAVSHVRVLRPWRSAQYLAIRLQTGRTHQVRVHLKSLGHPIVGDPIYAPGWERGFVGAGGRWAEEFATRCGRMFLHSARLVFRHPRTSERMAFVSRLPEPLASAAKWANETL